MASYNSKNHDHLAGELLYDASGDLRFGFNALQVMKHFYVSHIHKITPSGRQQTAVIVILPDAIAICSNRGGIHRYIHLQAIRMVVLCPRGRMVIHVKNEHDLLIMSPQAGKILLVMIQLVDSLGGQSLYVRHQEEMVSLDSLSLRPQGKYVSKVPEQLRQQIRNCMVSLLKDASSKARDFLVGMTEGEEGVGDDEIEYGSLSGSFSPSKKRSSISQERAGGRAGGAGKHTAQNSAGEKSIAEGGSLFNRTSASPSAPGASHHSSPSASSFHKDPNQSNATAGGGGGAASPAGPLFGDSRKSFSTIQHSPRGVKGQSQSFNTSAATAGGGGAPSPSMIEHKGAGDVDMSASQLIFEHSESHQIGGGASRPKYTAAATMQAAMHAAEERKKKGGYGASGSDPKQGTPGAAGHNNPFLAVNTKSAGTKKPSKIPNLTSKMQQVNDHATKHASLQEDDLTVVVVENRQSVITFPCVVSVWRYLQFIALNLPHATQAPTATVTNLEDSTQSIRINVTLLFQTMNMASDRMKHIVTFQRTSETDGFHLDGHVMWRANNESATIQMLNTGDTLNE